jgi:hypothetical protein
MTTAREALGDLRRRSLRNRSYEELSQKHAQIAYFLANETNPREQNLLKRRLCDVKQAMRDLNESEHYS